MGVPGWSRQGKGAWGGPRGGPSSPALAASASAWREPTRRGLSSEVCPDVLQPSQGWVPGPPHSPQRPASNAFCRRKGPMDVLLTSTTRPRPRERGTESSGQIRLGAGDLKGHLMLPSLHTHSQPLCEWYPETRYFPESPFCPGLCLLLLAKMALSTYPLQQTGRTGAQPDCRDWPQRRLVEWVDLAK